MNSQSNSQNLGLKCGNKQQSVFQRSQSVGSSTLIVPSQVSPLSRGLQSSLLPQGQTISQQAQEFLPYQPGPRIKRCLSGTTQAVFVKSPPASAVSHVLQTVNVNEISPAKMMTNQNGIVSPTTSQNSPTLNQNVNLRNVTIRSRCSIKPKVIVFSNNKVVCKNCGVTTLDANVCARCSASLQDMATTNNQGNVRERLNAERPKIEQEIVKGVSTSSFYNGTSSSDFTRYLKATTTKTSTVTTRSTLVLGKRTKPTENVCITISSDSEDECPTTTSSPTTPTSQSTGTETTETPNKIRRQKSDQETPTETANSEKLSTFTFPISPECSLIKTDEELSKTTLNLTVDSIRLGQMKLLPKSVMRISNEALSATVHCEALNLSTILSIKWANVAQCDVCVERQEPCLYLVLNQGSLPQLRESFSMEKGKYPYFDPNGKDDEKLFIIYINSVHLFTLSSQCNLEAFLRKIDLVRKKLKRPSTFIGRISYGESEHRQNMAAVAMRPSPTLVAAERTTHIVTRHNTRRSSNQVLENEEEIKMVFTGPRIELFVFPPPPGTGGISVTNEDRFCLNEGEFLNDVIIEFYLKYVYKQILSKVDRERTHIFSCFFYERLMQKNIGDKNKVKEVSPAERRHSQVKKWTRNVDIFSKDFIFVPINEAAHWYLAVICFPGVDFSEYECISNAAVMKQKKNIEKLDTTEVAKQVTQELPETMKYLSNYGDVDEVQGSQGQSSNSQDEQMDAYQRSNVSCSQSQNVQIDKSEEESKGQISSQPTHKGQSSNQLSPIGQSAHVNSVAISPEIKSTGTKRKLISIDLPSFHPRKKSCQSDSRDADKVKNSQNSVNDKNQNIEFKSEKKTSDSARTSPILARKNAVVKLKSKNGTSLIDEEISQSKKSIVDVKRQIGCHDKKKIIRNDETITLFSEDCVETSKSGENLKSQKTSIVLSQKSENNEIGTILGPKPLRSDSSCEVLTSSDESVCRLEISNLHSVNEDCKSGISESNTSEPTEDSTTENISKNNAYCNEKTLLVPSNRDNSLIINFVAEKCLSDVDISKSFVSSNIASELSEDVNNSGARNLTFDSSISTTHSAKDSICSYTECSNIEVDGTSSTKDFTSSPSERSQLQTISTKCSDIEIDATPASEDCMSSPIECLDDHKDVISNNNDVFELYVSPGNTHIGLSKDLERKCVISPNKRPQVHISRLPAGSCVENSPIKISSSTSLSSDDSVIVLSSPDGTESKNRKASNAKKSLIKFEMAFQSPEKVRDQIQEVKDEQAKTSQVECNLHEVKVHQKITKFGNAFSKTDGQDEVQHQDVKNPCVVEDDDLKDEGHQDEVESQSQIASSSSCDGVKSQSQIKPSSCNDLNMRHHSAGSVAEEKSLHLYLETSSHDLSNFDPLNSEPQHVTSSDQQSCTDLSLGCNICDTISITADNPTSQDASQTHGDIKGVESAISSEAKAADSATSCEASNASDSITSEQKSNSDNTKTTGSEEINLEVQKDVQSVKTGTFLKNESKNCNKNVNLSDNLEIKAEITGTRTAKDDRTSETDKFGNQPQSVFKRPCILIFDSLRGPPRSKIAMNLREYLTMEWNTRKKKSHGEKTFDKNTIKMSSAVVPQQDNYTDCGLFLLHYVEKFFSSPLQNYSPPVKLMNWFDPEECKTKRSKIKEIIDDLHEEWKKRDKME